MDKSYNYAIAYLKILACFGVVSLHFGSGGFGRKLAVPLFVSVSFYLGAKLFDCDDWRKLVNRVVRLMRPYVIWGFFGLLLSCVMAKISLIQVCDQMFFGRALGVPAGHLYYLELCAFITVLLFALRRLPRSMVLLSLIIGSFVLQYTGMNAALCKNLYSEAPNTVGRIVEFLPYACAGVAAAAVPVDSRLRGWWSIGGGLVVGLVSFGLFGRFVPNGFSYQGLPLFVLSMAVFVSAAWKGCAMPRFFQLRAVSEISAWTSGVYFVHMFVGYIVQRSLCVPHSFGLTVVVFLASMTLTGLLSRIKVLNALVK